MRKTKLSCLHYPLFHGAGTQSEAVKPCLNNCRDMRNIVLLTPSFTLVDNISIVDDFCLMERGGRMPSVSILKDFACKVMIGAFSQRSQTVMANISSSMTG
jgi:hypothetical protein